MDEVVESVTFLSHNCTFAKKCIMFTARLAYCPLVVWMCGTEQPRVSLGLRRDYTLYRYVHEEGLA